MSLKSYIGSLNWNGRAYKMTKFLRDLIIFNKVSHPYKDFLTVEVSPKNFPTTTENTFVWTKYRGKYVSSFTDNCHHHIKYKTLKAPTYIYYPIKYYKCKTYNEWVFSGPDLGLTKNILHNILEYQNINNDGRATFSILMLTNEVNY